MWLPLTVCSQIDRERERKREQQNNWICTPGGKIHALKALIYKSTSSFENRKPELRMLIKYNELEKGFSRFTYHEHRDHENCDRRRGGGEGRGAN